MVKVQEGTKEVPNYQVCFVNTEQVPKRVNKLGLFDYFEDASGKHFMELCEEFYPHPDAPEDATVSVYVFRRVEFPMVIQPTVIQSVDAMKALQNVKR